MNRCLFGALLLICASCTGSPPADLVKPELAFLSLAPDLPAGAVVLSSTSSGVLDQCSRPVPDVDQEFWQPDPSTVRAAEELLAALASSSQLCRPPRPFGGFIRQYLGVVSRGRRLLYVNAAAYDSEYPEPSYSEPVLYCDGGTSFWGALIDVSARRVLSIQVNGPLGPGYECVPAA